MTMTLLYPWQEVIQRDGDNDEESGDQGGAFEETYSVVTLIFCPMMIPGQPLGGKFLDVSPSRRHAAQSIHLQEIFAIR